MIAVIDQKEPGRAIMQAIGGTLIDAKVERPAIDVFPDLDSVLGLMETGQVKAVVVDARGRHIGPMEEICETAAIAEVPCYVIDPNQGEYTHAVCVPDAVHAARRIHQSGHYAQRH